MGFSVSPSPAKTCLGGRYSHQSLLSQRIIPLSQHKRALQDCVPVDFEDARAGCWVLAIKVSVGMFHGSVQIIPPPASPIQVLLPQLLCDTWSSLCSPGQGEGVVELN